MSPISAIIIGFILLGVTVLFFYPNKGLYYKLRKSMVNNQKIQIENALKKVYNYEYEGLKLDIHALAGNLNISGDEVAELICKLQEMELITLQQNNIVLTPAGRDYALKIIRIHRLWEKYLADRTGYAEDDWHEQAEIIEHTMSHEEANKLAAQIGNPVYDPHGDPIPTKEGLMHKIDGILLSEINPGQTCTIIHIEDEPKAIYTQLTAIGLYVGMHIKVVDKDKQKMQIITETQEAVLALLFARKVTVRINEQTTIQFEDAKPLATLKQGSSAIVVGISGACRGEQRRRLMDLGILPGTKISVEMVSPLGDPAAYLIRGTKIAVRSSQAEQIFVKEEEENNG